MDINKPFLAIALLLLAISLNTVAAEKIGLSIGDYGALPAVQMMSISPDGEMVAFRRHADDQDLLLVLSLSDSKVLQALDLSSINPRYLYFLDHSRIIMVVSDDNRRIRGYRGTHDISTAFSLDITSGEVTQLLRPGDVIYPAQTGLGRIWGISKDGKRLFMPAFVSRDRQDRNPSYSLVAVNLESVRRPSIVNRGSPNTLNYFLDDDGQILAEEIFHSRRSYHAILAYGSSKAEEIFKYQADYPQVSFHGLTPDREHLIYTTSDQKSDSLAYFQLSLKDGSITGPLFDRENLDVFRILTDINRVVYGVVYAGFSPIYHFFDQTLDKRVQNIQAQFQGQSVWVSDVSPDLKHLVIHVAGSGSSGEYYLFSEGKEPRLLATQRPNIPAAKVRPVITLEYKARDGLNIPTLLTVPHSDTDEFTNLPAILLPHGGPEAHDLLGFDWLAQALANEGYLVIQPQFRGSTGFGFQHRMAGRGEWGKKMQDDLTDALQGLIAGKVVDPQRVCILGASYGGYAALMAGALTPELYSCIISINGVTDIRRMMNEDRSKYGRDHWVLSYWEDIIASGDVSRSTLAEISPINHAKSITAPVLLIHGDNDRVVDYDQSRRMHRQLRRHKKATELVRLRGEDHYLSQADTRMNSLENIIHFVNSHIGVKE